MKNMPSLHSMALSLALLITSLHCCTNTCSAFVPSSPSSSPPPSSQQQRQQQNKKNGQRLPQKSSALSVGISFDEETAIADDADADADADERYRQLLLRASDCAKDEAGCSLEEWDSVMSEIEFISETNSAELERLMEGIHQMEERSSSKSLGLWTSRVFSRANLPVFIVMFLISTYGTITAPYDDIVIRVGWYVEDWGKVAASAPQASSHDFLWTCAMAANVALSEVISGYLPNESRS